MAAFPLTHNKKKILSNTQTNRQDLGIYRAEQKQFHESMKAAYAGTPHG